MEPLSTKWVTKPFFLVIAFAFSEIMNTRAVIDNTSILQKNSVGRTKKKTITGF